jgi:hypothetical protein
VILQNDTAFGSAISISNGNTIIDSQPMDEAVYPVSYASNFTNTFVLNMGVYTNEYLCFGITSTTNSQRLVSSGAAYPLGYMFYLSYNSATTVLAMCEKNEFQTMLYSDLGAISQNIGDTYQIRVANGSLTFWLNGTQVGPNPISVGSTGYYGWYGSWGGYRNSGHPAVGDNVTCTVNP